MIVLYVTEFFSERMGYSENTLPKAVASLGHEVHVIASDLQVYGNLPDYEKTYGRYLGPRIVPTGTKEIDGYLLHRLPHRLIGGYTDIKGLVRAVSALRPKVVQALNCASSSCLKLALASPIFGYKLYSECHQHLSVVKPFLRESDGRSLEKVRYRLTRTLPGFLASLFTIKCFAIAEDCAFVANEYFGVQKDKISFMPLGSDTELFCPPSNNSLANERDLLRQNLEVSENDILCIYTGRFSKDKNPLLLARAISILNEQGFSFKALFIGNGPQVDDILACHGCAVIPFVPFQELPKYYRAADIGVWPTQESLSMLDAASCGIPIVVSNRIGEPGRVEGNGVFYAEGDEEDLAAALYGLRSKDRRQQLGTAGRAKIVEKYSWIRIASDLVSEYGRSS
jgi:glycosyltransferase involved in cell wall biosynthesis